MPKRRIGELPRKKGESRAKAMERLYGKDWGSPLDERMHQYLRDIDLEELSELLKHD